MEVEEKIVVAMKKEPKVDLKQRAYNYIKDKIITGEFKPGQDIIEEDLQEAMGISRTPIREALMRLETDTLVSIYPRKGIFVSNITPKLIKNLFQIRKIIEPQVVRIIGKELSLEWLKDMRDKFSNVPEEFADNDSDYYVELDKEFHSYLICACDNQYLQNVMNNIYDQNQRMRYQTYNFNERDVATTNEHLGIIDALIERDVEKAVELMKIHIENSEEVSLKYIMI